eukprot:COSAG02_NODE_2088_length_9877_cov_3.833299_8_plen_81_part_01
MPGVTLVTLSMPGQNVLVTPGIRPYARCHGGAFVTPLAIYSTNPCFPILAAPWLNQTRPSVATNYDTVLVTGKTQSEVFN